MTREDLEEALKGNELNTTQIHATTVNNLMAYADVNLRMDRGTMEYYYEIDVDELLRSRMPKEELQSLKEEGWSFNKDKDKIIVYLTA